MSISPSTTRQIHTVLGGGIRYETAELILSTIPNFEFKQKERILHLFTEVRVQIQEALDERQNNFDSLLAHNPFPFESQIDTNIHPTNLSLKSTDESLQRSNETLPVLIAPNEINHNQQQKSNWTSVKDSPNIKTEAITPTKSKRRQSKKISSKLNQKNLSSNTSMRQMTMTQLFDSIESPKSNVNLTCIKQEPNTPADDTTMFMPESLIGLAQPSGSISDAENEQNNLSDLIPSVIKNQISMTQSLKRKFISSPIVDHNIREETTTTDEEEENIQNEALLQSPYAGVENQELLYACPMCRNYWLGLPDELRRKEGLTCRHQQQRRIASTPEHFWSLGIPNTQTCIQRGYGGVLPPDKPIERPRRPRRQHHRRLQDQQQQQEQNDEN